MTNDAEVAKLAQEAAEEIYNDPAMDEGGSPPVERLQAIITRLFSPAMTALREENERRSKSADAWYVKCLSAEKDISLLRTGVEAALQRVEAAEAERDRLRAAAKPFVDWIQWNGNLPTGEQGKALVAALTTAPTSEKEV